MTRLLTILLVLVCCLGASCAGIAADTAAKVETSSDALRTYLNADFDAAVTVRQVQTEDYVRWGKENGFPLSDPTNYDSVRFARLGALNLIEVSTFNKNGELISFFRAVWELHADSSGKKSGVYWQYQKIPGAKKPELGFIKALDGDVDLIGPVEMARQAIFRHVIYDELNNISSIYVDPVTKDVAEVWRGIPGEAPMKAIYSGYQLRDGRRVAGKLAFQMRTPGTGTLAKTVTTDLTDYKSQPEAKLFVDPIPPGTLVYDSIHERNYLQPKPGEPIDDQSE